VCVLLAHSVDATKVKEWPQCGFTQSENDFQEATGSATAKGWRRR